MDLSDDDFEDGEIEKINSLPGLDILAIVSEKVWEKEHFGVVGVRPLLSKKKPLPFDLNLKPRTQRKTRAIPIDVNDLLPCHNMKREQEDLDIDVKPPSPKRLKFTFHAQAPDPPVQPALPPKYIQRIAELRGSSQELVIQKPIFKSDVVPNNSRFAMPYKMCKVDFGEIGDQMKVMLIYKGIDNELKETMLNFKKWEVVYSYVFNGHWNELVVAAGLKPGDPVEVWSFKVGDRLSFALVKLDQVQPVIE